MTGPAGERRLILMLACAAGALAHAALAGPALPVFGDLPLYTSADGARSIALADLDGDGDLDILVASANDNRVSWLENDGNAPPGFTHRVITSVATGAQHVICLDLDGDERLDAVSAAFGADRIAWHQNLPGAAGPPGSPAAPPVWTTRTINTNADGAQSVAAADLNGDGATDVAAASFSDNKVAWHQQVPAPADPPGQPPTWISRTVSTGVTGASSIVAADIDLDGDVDLIAAAFSTNRIIWFENTPGAMPELPPVFIERTITSSAPGVIALHAVDAEGDGDTDLIAACFNDNSVRLYENLIAGPGMGPPTFATNTIDGAANGPVGVSTYDLDDDGDLDILSCSLFGNTVAWHERTPGMLPADPPVFVKHIVATSQGAPRLALGADLDADGDRDVASCSQNLDRVTLHDNLEPRVFNLTTGTGHQTVTAALVAAAPGDTIEVDRPNWIMRERSIDFAGKRARVQTLEPFVQSADAAFTLADRAVLAAAAGEEMSLGGQTGAGAFQRITLEAMEVAVELGGALSAGPGAFVEIDADMPFRIGGDVSIAGSLLSPLGVAIDENGVFELSGFTNGPIETDGEFVVSRDSDVFGAITVGEPGSASVTSALLTIDGALTVDGVFTVASGERDDERGADGALVEGSLTIGATGSMQVTGSTLTVEGPLAIEGGFTLTSDRPALIENAITGGADASLQIGAGATLEARSHIDLANTDAAAFEVAGTVLVGGAGARTFEVMSVNVGPNTAGLEPGEPGRFPLAALTIRTGATLNLVDAHDNGDDGQAVPEALYVGELVIETGGRLNVGVLRVFYGELTNNGLIDQPANLVIVGLCPADLNGDGMIGFADLNVIVSHFNAQGPPGTQTGDIDGDGLVGFSDLNIVVSAFNTDC